MSSRFETCRLIEHGPQTLVAALFFTAIVRNGIVVSGHVLGFMILVIWPRVYGWEAGIFLEVRDERWKKSNQQVVIHKPWHPTCVFGLSRDRQIARSVDQHCLDAEDKQPLPGGYGVEYWAGKMEQSCGRSRCAYPE
jgi:hypothetical protein